MDCSPTRRSSLFILCFVAVAGCGDHLGFSAPAQTGVGPAAAAPARAPSAANLPSPERAPAPLWADGHVTGTVDLAEPLDGGVALVDLGDAWTPYLFTESTELPNAYRATYLALARGETPDDHHGRRAERDRYLELYGVMPSVTVLRERMRTASSLDCVVDEDLSALREFDGTVGQSGARAAERAVRDFEQLAAKVAGIRERTGARDLATLDRTTLPAGDRDALARFDHVAPRMRAIRAVQRRLACEGFFRGTRQPTPYVYDAATRAAVAEFERRHRLLGRGGVAGSTLAALRESPMQLEHEAVLRVLTERAMQSAGAIEDGSVHGTWIDRAGVEHEVRDLEAETRAALVRAFGLATPEATLGWLERVGELSPTEHRTVAFLAPVLPEYYSRDMDLSVAVDRGDIWYEFPYDDAGRPIAQPLANRPSMTIYTTYLGRRIPLASFGTTIGGWHQEQVDGQTQWKFKNSPVGARVWTEIVAAPVWLPPSGTPGREVLNRARGGGYRLNRDLTGPSYASAYGLVAAYHRRTATAADGTLRITGDEGIRTHGSVNYMSIARSSSHGCHRLLNHMAVRLMSFVLARREHARSGEQATHYRNSFDMNGEPVAVAIDQGGYEFHLARPLPVEVLEGRVRGTLTAPIATAIPMFDATRGGYFLADGTQVVVRGSELVAVVPEPAPVAPAALPVDALAQINIGTVAQ